MATKRIFACDCCGEEVECPGTLGLPPAAVEMEIRGYVNAGKNTKTFLKMVCLCGKCLPRFDAALGVFNARADERHEYQND